MRKQTVNLNLIGLACFMVGILAFTGWVKNLIKLSECDFQAPYKAEVIHSIGIVPVVGIVTGWLDVGK